jgi:hypothetical protein
LAEQEQRTLPGTTACLRPLLLLAAAVVLAILKIRLSVVLAVVTVQVALVHPLALLIKVLAGVLTGQGPMLVKHVLVLAAVQVL